MRVYSRKYETWWLDRARARLSGMGDTHVLRHLEPVVKELSDQFTIYREEGAVESYERPEQILAYGLFFFPQTYVRACQVVEELQERVAWKAPTDRPLRVLDLGCGSGAGSFALLDRLDQAGSDIEVEHYGVDRCALNLDAARELSEMLSYEHIQVRSEWLKRDVTRAGFSWQNKPFHEPWDIVLMSFSFGEFVSGLGDEQAVEVVRDLGGALGDSGVVVIIEPALMETAVRLEVIRDAIAGTSGLQVLAPCLHQKPCPALDRRNFWCHEVRKWHPPELLAFLNTRLHRNIRFLKFSFLVFEKSSKSKIPRPDESGETHFRMVSPVAKKSGQMVCKGCAASGKIHTYEWLTRNLSKAQIRNHLDLERGDCVVEKHLRVLGTQGRYRVERR